MVESDEKKFPYQKLLESMDMSKGNKIEKNFPVREGSESTILRMMKEHKASLSEHENKEIKG